MLTVQRQAPTEAPTPTRQANPTMVRCQCCQGWHPGGADRCWLNSQFAGNRLGEAAYMAYAATILPKIPRSFPIAMDHPNHKVKNGDRLIYAIVTDSAFKKLRREDGSFSMKCTLEGDDKLLIVYPPTTQEDPPNPKDDKASMDEEIRKMDATIGQHTHALLMQDKEKVLKGLQEQLATGPQSQSLNGKKCLPHLNMLNELRNNPNGGQQGGDQQGGQNAGKDVGKHIPANVGHWRRTGRGSKWTSKQIDEVLGHTTLARLGMWHNFTSIYDNEDVTEELKQAVLKAGDNTVVATALHAAGLAISDIKEMSEAKKTGNLLEALEL